MLATATVPPAVNQIEYHPYLRNDALVVSVAAGVPVSAQSQEQAEGTGLTWFEGSFEELMSEARASKKIVFLDFWAEW